MNAPEPQPAIAVALLPVGAICASPSNPRRRIDDAYIAELADSIKAHGLIQPITLRPNPRGNTLYEIVVGECRWRAARRAGLAMIPAFWPVYSNKPIPKKFQHPKRDALPLNVPHEGADAASSRTLPLDVVVGARAQTEE